MKFTTFRNLLLSGAVLVAVGGGFYLSRPRHAAPPAVIPATTPTDETKRPDPTPPSKPEPTATPRALVDPPKTDAERGAAAPTSDQHGARVPLRAMDRELLQLVKQGGKPARVKDAFPKSPYKINLYLEGDQLVRAKIDLNRNGKWDEKWTFAQDKGESTVKRQVSPTDDDTSYTLTYKLAGEAWVQK